MSILILPFAEFCPKRQHLFTVFCQRFIKACPGSLILSGAMMLDHMLWHEAADLIH